MQFGSLCIDRKQTKNYSDNQGDTWDESFTSSCIYDFASGGGNGYTIVVLEDGGVKISNDGGKNFFPIVLGEEQEDSEGSLFRWSALRSCHRLDPKSGFLFALVTVG